MKFVKWECGCIAIESEGDAIVLQSHERPDEIMFSYQKGGALVERKGVLELGDIDQALVQATMKGIIRDGYSFRAIKRFINE